MAHTKPNDPDHLEIALWHAIRTRNAKNVEAALATNPDLAKSLGPCGDALAWAVDCQAVNPLLLLLSRGANPNTHNASGYTPLHLAILSDFKERDEMVATLIEFKADPNLPGHHGETPLISAARKQRTICARLLLQAGADPNLVSNLGEQTALMWASYFNQKEMVLDLVAAGANVDALDTDGRRPTEWAQVSGPGKSSEVVHILEVTSVKVALDQTVPEPNAPEKRSPRL